MEFYKYVLVWFVMSLLTLKWLMFVERRDKQNEHRPKYEIQTLILFSFTLWFVFLPIAIIDWITKVIFRKEA